MMGFSEIVGGVYSKIEEGFYSAMDFLADKGLPVYLVIDPLEERGVPFFPLALALLVLVVFLAYGALFLSTVSTSVRLSLTDTIGEPLAGVTLKAFDDSSGKEIQLDSAIFQDSQEFKIPIGKGGRVRLEASKEGYNPASASVYLSDASVDASLRLEKDIKLLEGRIRLVDNDTGDAVGSATVAAKFSDNAGVECLEANDGIYTCPGVGEGQATVITVRQPNYEDKTFTQKFVSDSVSEVQLVAKAAAATGMASVVVRAFDDGTKERAGNFTLRVYDAKSNELITEATETDGDGEQIEKVSKGTSIRIVVEKSGYLTYDSDSAGENQTLRDDEVLREIYLKPGTNALTVGVVDAASSPLSQMRVSLFSGTGALLAQKQTSLAGEATFEGLDAGLTYYVGSWSDLYLPARQEVVLSQQNRVTLTMQRAVANNSGQLVVHAVDGKSFALNDATLNFFEETGGGKTAPLGIPPQKTDVSGKFEMLAPLDANIVIRAVKGGLEGEASIGISQTFGNDVIVMLLEPSSSVLLKVLDDSGVEMSGGTLAVFGGKDAIFEGGYSEGGIMFNPGAYEYVSVRYSGVDGKSFEEEVYVKDMNEVSISPKGTNSNGTTPTVEYMGIYTPDGSKTEGISKGADYYLQFRAVYADGTTDNGLHVRLGPDSVAFADSQDAGILGYSAVGAAAFYGRSYNAVPAPGFEAQDFENSGNEGQYNKFIELYFASGGEKIVKVRVKAKETSQDADVEVHYRAFSVIGDRKYRNPTDSELGLDEYSAKRTSLYAQTLVQKVRILEASASCGSDLCASYKFVRSDGSEYAVDNFRAALAELYALEVDFAPAEGKRVTVKASTSKLKPKIAFQGFGVDNFSGFPDTNSSDTSIEAQNVQLDGTETTGVRLYFKANGVENSTITLQLISDDTVINRQFHFSVYKQNNISMTTMPGAVSFGQDFIVVLQDEEKNPIENAQLKLTSLSGAHVLTIAGDGSQKRGLSGRYSVKNSFDAGTIRYEVSAPNFRLLQGTIEVTKAGILEFGSIEVYVNVPKGKQDGQQQLELRNRSKQSVQQISFEVQPVGELPEGMEIKVSPLSSLGANANQRLAVSASYTGSLESAHGEARVIARARTEQGFTVSAETKVVADYNPEIPQDCIEFSKGSIVVYVASGMDDRSFYDSQYQSRYGASTSNALSPTDPTSYYRYSGFAAGSHETFTAKLAQKPKCQLEFNLKPEVVARGQKDAGITVESEEIRLSPQLQNTGQGGGRTDTKEVAITVSNSMLRNYPGRQSFKYDVVYKGDSFEKSVQIEVIVWNPRYALQVSRNIELYLGPDQTGKYGAQVPLFVRNIGEADIENVNFRVSSSTSSGNVQVQVVPDFPIQFLRKGDSIDPPKTLVAQVLRNEKTTLVDEKVLDITGVIDGITFSFGPVNVISHISAAQCITAVPSNITFISTTTQGALELPITIRNTCAEEARILGISQPPIGANRLYLYPEAGYLPPGGEAQFVMRLEKKENYSGPVQPVYVHAFLPISGTPIDSNPVIVDIKLGKNVAKGTAATEEVTMDVCEGGTKNVRMPVIASGNSPLCDTAYCDASQLANFLANRVQDKIRDAEKQIQNRSAEIQKTDCSQYDLARGFCTFDGLGVKNETFYVYLSHDNLSPEIMNKALDGVNGTAKGFRAQFFQGTSGGEYLGGYSKQIFMNNNIRGCGRYAIKLNGTVGVQGSHIVPDLMNVVVDVVHDQGEPVKQLTEQCTPLIQNVANFLPRDEGLTKNSKYATWMGIVQPRDQSLEALSADIAKGLFGSDQRSVAGDISTNALSLDLGNTEGYIVKLQMDKSPSDNPVKVRALVRESIGADQQLQKEIASEAGQALKNLRDFAVTACIGADESYIQIKSNKDLAKPEIKVRDKLNVQFSAETCQELNVNSNIRQVVNLTARKETKFDGLEGEPYFKKKPANDKEAPTEQISSITADRLDPKTNKFSGQALICVKGNSQFAQTQGKSIIIEGRPAEAGSKSAKIQPVKAELQVCGIHPIAFLEKSKSLETTKGEENYYYATFVWKGNPEQINIADVAKLNQTQETVNKANAIIDNKRAPSKTDPPEVVTAKRKAAMTYFGWCAGTSVLTSIARPTIGLAFWGVFLNVLTDCGYPFSQLMGETGGIAKQIADGVNNVLSFPVTVLKALGNLVGIGGGDVQQAQTQFVAAAQQSDKFDVLENFGIALLIKDSVKAVFMTPTTFAGTNIQAGGKLQSATNAAKAVSEAHVMAENVIDGLIKKYEEKAFGVSPIGPTLGGEPLPTVKDHTNVLRAKWRELAFKGIDEEIGLRGKAFTAGELTQIIQKSAAEAGSDKDVIDSLAKVKSITSTQPNAYLDQDTFKKELLEDIGKTSEAIVTGDSPVNYVDNVTERSINGQSIGEIADSTTGTLKRDMMAAYAEKMGVANPDEIKTLINGDTALKAKFDSIKVSPESKLVQITPPRATTPSFKYEVRILKSEEDRAISEIQKIFNTMTETAIKDPAKYPVLQKKISESFAKKGMPKAISSLSGEVDAKDGIPKLLSKKGLGVFLKNVLKDGAFGLLSNAVGLYFYDKSLTNQLKGLNYKPENITREQELVNAGVGLFGQAFSCEAGSNCILKYRTYKISVMTQSDGKKNITLGLTNHIPNGIDAKKYVLNDCQNPGFNDGISGTLPGLMPLIEPADKYPKVFQKNAGMNALHVKIVRSYLAPQANGERYGAMITEAVERNSQTGLYPTFKAQTDMDLEALVVATGIIKSALGNDSPDKVTPVMFGCSLGDRTIEDPRNNARCTAQKMVSYIPQCNTVATNKAACFLRKYEQDTKLPSNQKSYATGLNVTDEQFQDIYNTWASLAYTWRAS